MVNGEHTGLLKRAPREDLEAAFKAGTAPDAPNVLTATPTLEMGIDIGDLSSVMLTSVPRTPASYIQRVGRSGRSSGNSLVTTFVPTDTHGLYYLADPEAMLAGDVRPPNCYLDAAEILQRQFIAYLVDRTADGAIEAPRLPRRISKLMKKALDTGGFLRTVIDASVGDPQHLAEHLGNSQLGINQLGAVYEGLMAYTGFFATGDLFEVAKGGDPSGGTWMLPVTDADEYPDDVFVMAENPTTGRNERVRDNKGSFVFRLSGRDRQRSASYYTPEVLTRCVVHHALAELLGLDDYAPEGGSANIQDATELLDLTICEPALGSGAFLNEAINQLSAEYLKRRQAELGETLDPDAYLRELQKVKAHFALHQSYGVDLNATAVELAEVSLWLNAMHPGLKAPWLGLQLRRGNSLIGARRATWKVGQLKHRPWAETRKATGSLRWIARCQRHHLVRSRYVRIAPSQRSDYSRFTIGSWPQCC